LDTWEFGGAKLTLLTDTTTISVATGGVQKFALDAGSQHAKRLYWLFGSFTGTTPGITLISAIGPVLIPLNPDAWTNLTIGLANTPTLQNTKSVLDAAGKAQAALALPKITIPSAIGRVVHHSYLVYDASSNFYMASNPAKLTLVK
jgi:hypothetical protein